MINKFQKLLKKSDKLHRLSEKHKLDLLNSDISFKDRELVENAFDRVKDKINIGMIKDYINRVE